MSYEKKDKTIQVTKAQLDTLISANKLIPTWTYNITDAAIDSQGLTANIFVEAIDGNKLANFGKRLMYVVKDSWYTPQIVTGLNNTRYLGIYGQNITAGSTPNSNLAIGGTTYFAIWGGRMWQRNTSGADLPPLSYYTHNSTGWSLVPFSNNSMYDLREFEIIYNYELNRIVQQSDWKGNTLKFGETSGYLDEFQYTDWGNESIINNLLFVSDFSTKISNNWFNSTTRAIIVGNTNSGWIINNRGGFIKNNKNIGNIEQNSNNGNIIGNYNSGNIFNNSNNGPILNNGNIADISNNSNGSNINNNINGGGITNNSNSTQINTNSNNGGISNNSNNGNVAGNYNGGAISDNLSNVTNIQYNGNSFNINNNNNTGSIDSNINQGGIVSNTNNGQIFKNHNNGDISTNSNAGNINLNGNAGNINGNSNGGLINGNKNNGLIANNSHNGTILNNSNIGSIQQNTSNVGTTMSITNNRNTGVIARNNSTANILIQFNINNGSVGNIITTTNRAATVQDTQVNK
jgi:hypothetical protein